jgi:hypothetical protein
MTDHHEHEANETWLDYLQAVQSLSAEMNAGLAAIAGNDLARFESSVAEQERLAETARALRQGLRGSSLPAPLPQLAAAGRQLQQGSRVYAAVVMRAAQVGSALLSLYQGSPPGYSRDGRALPNTKSWSCEV